MRNFSALDLAFCKSYKLRGLPCCCRQEIPNGFGGELELEGAEIFQNFCDSTFLVLGSDLYFVDVSSLFSFANVLSLG